MLAEDLQIYKDTYNLCKQLTTYQQRVAKAIRYGEYGKAVSLAFDAMDEIYQINRDIAGRAERLDRYLGYIGGVRSRVRLFGELDLLTTREATALMVLVDSVAKQATGWRNASQRNARAVTGTPNTGVQRG